MWQELVLGQIVLAVGYLVVVRRRQSWVIAGLIALLPILGVLLAAMLHGCATRSVQGEENVYDALRGDMTVLRRPEEEEYQLLPVRDILHFHDLKEKRRLMGRVIQKGLLKNPAVLREAIRSEDPEVAHYAVAVLTHRQSQLEVELRRARELLQKEASGESAILQFVETAAQYRRLDGLDKNSMELFLTDYLTILNKGLRLCAHELLFEEMVACQLALGQLSEALETAQAFQTAFPVEEKSYISLLEIYYLLQKPEKIYETIEQMGRHVPVFSAEALQLTRFWRKEAGHAS